MYDIHDDGNVHLMCRINELFQFFRCTETGRRCKETGYMISETAIVRMLLNGHNLNTVVSVFRDTRKHVLTELVVRTHLFRILCHTDVTLVNHQRRHIRRKALFLELVRFLRIPYLCTENLGLLILHHASSPRRNTFTASAFPIHFQFVQVAMLQGFFRKIDFPVTCLAHPFQAERRFLLPAVEVAYQIDFRRIRCPFTECPSFFCTMQTEIHVSGCKIRQCLFAHQFLFFLYCMLMTAINRIGIRFQPWIILYDIQYLVHSISY